MARPLDEFKGIVAEFRGEAQEGMDPDINGDDEAVAWSLSICVGRRLTLEEKLGKHMVSPAKRLELGLKLIDLENKERLMKEWLEAKVEIKEDRHAS